MSATSGSAMWLHARCPGVDEATVAVRDELAFEPDLVVELLDFLPVGIEVVAQPVSKTAITTVTITHLTVAAHRCI
ncbi:hypothetical protein [Ferrimicrobium sp.]|uniref:hypothetical protein n=1 Tax=Ferrimicrobium sp. TaxID=2926050 RepID=UPI002615BD30|nr:hypothetical protein [Ferrimicrobium sp.]